MPNWAAFRGAKDGGWFTCMLGTAHRDFRTTIYNFQQNLGAASSMARLIGGRIDDDGQPKPLLVISTASIGRFCVLSCATHVPSRFLDYP